MKAVDLIQGLPGERSLSLNPHMLKTKSNQHAKELPVGLHEFALMGVKQIGCKKSF